MEHSKKYRKNPKDIKTAPKRTSVYYCHPYCSCEKPQVERHNRLFRRYSPKGQSMANLTQKKCDRIAEAINTLPRKILDYNTPAELFRKQIELLEKESLAESTKSTAGENDTGPAIVKK